MTDLQTAATVDWRDTLEVGLGIAAPSGQPMRQAVERFELPRVDEAISTGFKFVTVDSHEKGSQLVDVSDSANFSLGGVQGKFSAAWRNQISYDSRRMTVLLQSWIDWQPQKALLSSLRLTDEAKAVLAKGAQRLRRAYGDYFVAGYQRRARLFVAYKLEPQDESSLAQFKASVSASGFGSVAEGSTELRHLAEKHNVRLASAFRKACAASRTRS